MIRICIIMLALLLVFAGCFGREEPQPAPLPPQPLPPVLPEEREEEPQPPVFQGPTTGEYIHMVVEETIDRITIPDMSEVEKIKAAYDYLIEVGYYHLPVAMDIWRIRSVAEEPPSFLENRALGMLLFGMGTCEDYTAALVLLLQGMGIEARYLPGLTYAVEGDLVHHAWAQARVNGVWYHLDCELEDGVSQGVVRYRYFLKSDATMRASHLWGQELIQSRRLTEDQNEEIAREYLGERCPRDYPTPLPSSIPVTPGPDEEALLADLQEELWEFESLYGELDYLDLEILPPVFGRHGGYWSGEYWTFDDEHWITRGMQARLLVQPQA